MRLPSGKILRVRASIIIKNYGKRKGILQDEWFIKVLFVDRTVQILTYYSEEDYNCDLNFIRKNIWWTC